MHMKNMSRAVTTRWSGFSYVYSSQLSRRQCIRLSSMEVSNPYHPPPFRLFGPPEIHHSNRVHVLDQMASIKSAFEKFVPTLGHYEKQPLYCFANPCLRLYSNQIYGKSMIPLRYWLEASWDYCPLTTLKLICFILRTNSSRIRGKDEFYTAAFWLHKYHPKTLACNVKIFTKFGCLKDLLEILYRLVEGFNVRRDAIDKRKIMTIKRQHKLFEKRILSKIPIDKRPRSYSYEIEEEEEVSLTREEQRIVKAKTAVEMYNSDPKYRFLYDQISDVFVELLKSDLGYLKSGETEKISLAAKWCPSLYSSYDRSLLFCESVARRLFPYDSDPEYRGIKEAYYAYRVRNRLQKQVVVPLRKVLHLPEVYMSANEWSRLPYNRVTGIALKKYKKLFFKHDKERFVNYLRIEKPGVKQKVTACVLPPLQIMLKIIFQYRFYERESVELQWRTLVEYFSRKGNFKNCIIVSCLSEFNRPLELQYDFSFTFGLLTSDLNDSPWKGKVFVGGSDPQIVEIKGNDLLAKFNYLRSLNGRDCIELWKVLDKILETALKSQLSNENMIKRIYFFCYFGDGASHWYQWNTKCAPFREKFEKSGYTMPDIVFWSLYIKDRVPCVQSQKGLMLVYGISETICKTFLERDGALSQMAVMESDISGEEYMKLEVFD